MSEATGRPWTPAIGQLGSVDAKELAASKANLVEYLEGIKAEVRQGGGWPGGPLAAHFASINTALRALDEQAATIREAVRIMEPFAAHSDDDPNVTRMHRMMFAPIRAFRALAAFVSKHKEPTDAR